MLKVPLQPLTIIKIYLPLLKNNFYQRYSSLNFGGKKSFVGFLTAKFLKSKTESVGWQQVRSCNVAHHSKSHI